jgi:hypothetical protein
MTQPENDVQRVHCNFLLHFFSRPNVSFSRERKGVGSACIRIIQRVAVVSLRHPKQFRLHSAAGC